VVVTTLFPLYDFARNVGGDKADVSLLLPPGVEPHSFEPKPADLLRIHRADIFVYTGDFMEPWAAVLVKGAGKDGPLIVDSSRGVALQAPAQGAAEGRMDTGAHAGAAHTADPHIWLDFGNAQVMVDNILAAFVEKDPANRAFYEKNARGYKARLAGLDEEFKKGLASCATYLFVHGGHSAFSYLARRYGLTYVSVYGVTPNAEPSPRRLAWIVGEMRRSGVRYVFYEELIQPRMAETLAREAGAELLPLNGGHNVTRDQVEKGVTFIAIMENDLKNLRAGLQCR
jgi:zinc transport system substrate-binding protein